MESGGEVPSACRAAEALVPRAGVKRPQVHQCRLSGDPGKGR